MLYINHYSNFEAPLLETVNPVSVFAIESLCKHFNISTVTSNINKAKVFPIDIIYFVDFARELDANKFLSSEIKKRINSGNAVLVLNVSHERIHKYSKAEHWVVYWEMIYSKLNEAGIDLNRVVYISGDVNIEKNFKAHNDSSRVIGLDSFEYIYNEWTKSRNTAVSEFSLDKEFDFLFLNSVPRAHRCIIRYLLQKENLLERSIHSWVIGNRLPNVFDIQGFIDTKGFWPLRANNVAKFCSVEKTLDSSFADLFGKGRQNFIPKDYLDKTMYSFITESDFLKNVMLVSEKTYKVLLQKHPFMVYGHPEMLKYLVTCGYQTYEELFEESYDSLECEKEKIQLFIDNIKHFRDRAAGKEKIINEKLEYNRQHFLSQPCAEKTKQKLMGLFE